MMINPNPRAMSLIQPVVPLFYSILKNARIQMKFFDTTFYDVSTKYTNTDKYKQSILGVKQYDDKYSKFSSFQKSDENLYSDWRKIIEEYKPDFLLVSAMESTITFARELMAHVRDLKTINILGGVFPTYSPEDSIKYPEVDIVCVGEAEKTLVPLLKNLYSKKSVTDIPGIWSKNGTSILKPKLKVSHICSLDDNPIFDASIIDDSRFYRAMAGNIYKMFPVETHRGCNNKCTFCNSPLQNKMYKEEVGQNYFRKKSISKVMEDIKYMVEEKGAEYFFFWADNFLTYSKKEIDEFCEMYSIYKKPFYAQSYPVSIDEYKIKKMVEVGLHRVGLGIEHGNEKFRAEIINRPYSNQVAIDKISILRKYGIQYSCNNIVGFPLETPELHKDTIELNRALKAHTASCSIFTPFRGTPLRELCIKNNYLEDANCIAPTNSESSILNMPQFTKDQILGKARTFVLYVNFPKSRWKNIEKAEKITPEGNLIWEELKQEYKEKYQ